MFSSIQLQQLQNLPPKVKEIASSLILLTAIFDQQLKSGQCEAVVKQCNSALDKSNNNGFFDFYFYHYRSLGNEYGQDFAKSYSDAKKALGSLTKIKQQNATVNFSPFEKVLSDRVFLLRGKSKKWWQFWK